MRTILLTLLPLIGALALFFASRAAAQPVRGEPALILQIRDHSGMFDATPLGTLCLASNANNWDPKGTWSFAHEAPTSKVRGGWLIAIPRRVIDETVRANGRFEFKLTRGSWETVEVGPDGRDISNRVLPAVDFSGYERGEGSPTLTLALEGFADQRGTRWNAAARASTVTGTLDVLEHASAIRKNTRKIRVWTPPGYGDPKNAERRYPVLFMHDGQNCFDDATAFAGEWRVDETMTELIAAGKVPPTIVVGIDNAGPDRANEYVPIKVGPRMPAQGGLADEYLDMLEREIIPLIDARYRTIANAEKRALGGSSFGGIITLHAAMSRPGAFGAILVESPSVWIGAQPGDYVKTIAAHDKPWPRRVFMATGGQEYGDPARDVPLQELFKQAEAAMRKQGLDETRMRAFIEPEGRHNEQTWARRLPEALVFLLGE